MSATALRSLLLGGAGGAGGVVVARYILPDITYQEKTKTPGLVENGGLGLVENGGNSRSRILKYGVPSPGIPTIIEYENHVLEYDAVRRVPKWVAEHVSQTKAFGEVANRKMAKFDADPTVPAHFASNNKDFWGSGWSRGHMAPAGNNKHSQTAMNQTFYLTNIVPQDLENNGNYWNRLEIYCRDLTKLYQDVYIISGPLWLPEEDKTSNNDKPLTSDQTKTSKLTVVDVEQKLTETPASSIIGASAGDVVVQPKWVRPPRPPKKFVKYEVIGTNNVAVPSHLFKVILVEDPQLDKPMMASFIIPNKPVQDVKLEDFEVSLSEVEKQVGVRFHQDLDHESGVDRLCLMDGCQLNNYKQFQEFFWTRRIKTPLNSRFLENDWKEVCKRGMSTPELQEIYLTKKQELLEKETQRREEKANGGDDKPVVIKIGPVLEEATNTNPEGLKRNPASAA